MSQSVLNRLELNGILADCGLPKNARPLGCPMVLNRLMSWPPPRLNKRSEAHDLLAPILKGLFLALLRCEVELGYCSLGGSESESAAPPHACGIAGWLLRRAHS